MTFLAPRRLFDGHAIREGGAVQVDDGRIVRVVDSAPAEATPLDGLLAPGFIDIQVNGGGGVLFNDAPQVESLHTIAAAHRQFGVTGYLATLISDRREKMEAAFNAVAEAVAQRVPGVMGLHFEGPWLAEPRRGVHPAAHLRDFDDEDLALLSRPRDFPLLVTLAPERITPSRLQALADAGVVVALGHTAAHAAEVEAALSGGATGFTHLFNAMPPLESRQPGPVGAALARRDAFAGLILDGIHVHPLTARAALAAKTPARMILVSDSMATVGAANPDMSLFGEKLTLSGGALRTPAGTLAGAHLDLSQAVRNAVAMLGASPADALRMASLTPAEFMGVSSTRGCIAPGARADFVLLNDALYVERVWTGGREASLRGP